MNTQLSKACNLRPSPLCSKIETQGTIMFARMRVKCISGAAVRSQPVTTESNADQGSSRLNAAFVSNNSKSGNCTAF